MRFPIYFQSIDTDLGVVNHVRKLAVLLTIDAHVALRAGDQERTLEDIIALYDLSTHLDAIPATVAQLIAIAVRRFALETVQSCVAVDLLTDISCDDLIKDFKSTAILAIDGRNLCVTRWAGLYLSS